MWPLVVCARVCGDVAIWEGSWSSNDVTSRSEAMIVEPFEMPRGESLIS